MRYHHPNYPKLMVEYEQQLQNQVDAGQITTEAKEAHLDYADKLFETLVVAMPQAVMESYVQARGFRGPYARVIGQLKEIAIRRERPF